MALYEALATQADVAAYMGITVGDLPSDVDVRIQRASEDIWNLMHMNYNEDDDEHVEAAQLATSAQVAYVYEGSDTAKYDQVKIGTLSVKYDKSSKEKGSRMAPKARDYLERVGLLSRAVKLK